MHIYCIYICKNVDLSYAFDSNHKICSDVNNTLFNFFLKISLGQ